MHKNKFRLLSLALSGAFAAASLAGCGSGANNSNGTAAPAVSETSKAVSTDENSSGTDGGGDTIDLTCYYPVNVGGDTANIIDGMVDEFNKSQSKIHVKSVYSGNYDDTVTALQTAKAGGNPPELFISLATQRFTMASTNMAMPLDDLIANDPDGKTYIDDFLDGFMVDSYVDGKIYSIPFQRSTEILYYNKDAFKEVGLDPDSPPTTWEELADYAVKLTNSKRYGVGIALNSGSAQWTFTGFCLQNSKNGENLMSDDGKKVFFNTKENVEALQFWLDLQNKYKCMATGIVQWTDLPTQFLSGDVAMIYHTTGNMANISSNATFDFGACYLPGHVRQAAPTGGGNFYITKGISEEKQQAAWEFIKFMTDTERAAKWSVATGYVPVRKSCFETDTIKDYYSSIPQAKVAYDQLENATIGCELTTYNAAEIWRVLNDNIQSAVIGDATAQEALDNAQKEATEVLEDYQ